MACPHVQTQAIISELRKDSLACAILDRVDAGPFVSIDLIVIFCFKYMFGRVPLDDINSLKALRAETSSLRLCEVVKLRTLRIQNIPIGNRVFPVRYYPLVRAIFLTSPRFPSIY